MRWCGCVVGLGLALATAPALGDEVLEQIDVARDLYLEGELTDAITELEFAIQSIRARTGDLYAGTFPEPPAGWTASEVDVVAGLPGMSGQMLSRSYEGPAGQRIDAELMVDNPMLQAFGALLQNPALLSMQPHAERVRVQRAPAILQWPEDGTGELMLMLGGRLLLKLDGSGLGDRADLLDLMEAWDVATVRRLAGL